MSLAVLWLMLGVGCSAGAAVQQTEVHRHIDLQGHRGARGLLPENTIPSFLKAADLGVDTIELDVVLTADRHAVVSHEPWFSHEICSKPDGEPVAESEERQLNIYGMTYDEVSQYDCGLRGNPRFPQQRSVSASKPLLSSVIQAVEEHVSRLNRTPVAYNIEIKSGPDGDGKYHPAPDTFALVVYNEIASHDILPRTTIQSFDPRSLEAMKDIDSTVTIALLVDNDLGIEANLERLSFRPDIYSPNQRLVNQKVIEVAHSAGIKVVPWTVNEEKDMRTLLDLGVDGLITDYPNVGRHVVQDYE